MARYSITRRAQQDLDEILIYIAEDNIDAAITLIDRFTAVFEMLADNGKAGRERPELKEDLRSFPESSYLIFYRMWAGKAAIVRVIHGARDLDEIFS